VLAEDHRLLLEQVGRFAQREFFGLQERMDADEWWPEGAFPALGARLRARLVRGTSDAPASTTPAVLGGRGPRPWS
jgi:hypothetical protein